MTVTARARVHWQIYTPAGPGPGRGSGNLCGNSSWGLIGLTNFWWGLVRSHWQAQPPCTAATGSGRRYSCIWCSVRVRSPDADAAGEHPEDYADAISAWHLRGLRI